MSMDVNVTQSLPCTIRNARNGDGTDIWKLVTESGTPDVNSAYCYIMLCEYFADTCIVAEHNRNIIGFVSALRPPEMPDTVFVWQIAVRAGYRGRGSPKRCCAHCTRRHADRVRYMETTIAPSNKASQRLFAKMAKTWKSALVTKEGSPLSYFRKERMRPRS